LFIIQVFSLLHLDPLTSGLCLFLCSSGQTNITAEPGKNVTLTCRAPSSTNITTVEWTRPDLDPKEIFVYRDGRFDPDNQHPSVKERVELKDSQMKDGDVSVTLKNVTFNDTGTYECRVLQSQSKAPELTNITHLTILTVEWTRPDLGTDYVFLYQDGRFDPDNQHPSFKERVELKDSQMKDGDVSVTLKNVTFTDNGTYECRFVLFFSHHLPDTSHQMSIHFHLGVYSLVGQQIYTVIQAVHSLLYIVAKCHFFSVVT
uniref:Ig-like domain-containing protein n=1 Tax=Mastacembelus armatus TaxID=205130 RepID=A0A3Q3M340_9TELE